MSAAIDTMPPAGSLRSLIWYQRPFACRCVIVRPDLRAFIRRESAAPAAGSASATEYAVPVATNAAKDLPFASWIDASFAALAYSRFHSCRQSSSS